MTRTLLVLTIVIDLAVIGIWLALGAHLGWSMTQVPVKKIDPVTEIEFTEYDHRFVPGVDFLAAGLIGSAICLWTHRIQIHRQTRIMKLTRLIAIIAIGLTAVHAEPLTFDFKDPMGVNNVVFKLDAPLESINGTASGVSGTVTIDPANPGEAKGKIVVATDSLTVPNPLMKEHLVGEKWLNAKAHPEITFEIKSISNIEKKDTKGEAKVTGTFTLNGVSKDITVDAKVTYLPGKLGDRTGGKLQGDLLVIRTEFKIKRSDYNIQPGQRLEKVSDEIALSLSIAGAAPKG